VSNFSSNSRLDGHFGDEPFDAITYTGTDNSKQTRENTPKTHKIK